MAEEYFSYNGGMADKNGMYFSLCQFCNSEFKEKSSKLLPCLHSLCEDCLARKPSASTSTQLAGGSDTDKTDSETSTNSDKQGNSVGKEAQEISKDATQKKADESEDGGNKGADKTEASSTVDDGKVQCLVCGLVFNIEQVLDNPFTKTVTLKQDPKSEDGSPSEEKFNVCTGCDDSQKATSFCIQCQEWLCDQCVNAHRRVRVTKDHTFSSKVQSESTTAPDALSQKQIFCKVHKTEKMKLFCITCDMLTCRDCQLLEHKDHKYQFIDEAVSQQKSDLEKSLQTLKNRLDSNIQLSEKISAREKEIKRQQMQIFTEVRQVADAVTNELIGYCKKLLNFLSGVCHGKVKLLAEKKNETDSFTKNAEHCITFVEAALQSGNDLSVLHTKSLMMKQLTSLLDRNIDVSQGMFELKMKYDNESSFLTKNVEKMGTINVNGRSYPSPHGQTPTPPPLTPHTNNSAATPQQQQASQQNNPTFPQQVMEWLNKSPAYVRERYRKMNPDERKKFLQQLVNSHMRTNPASQNSGMPPALQQMQHQQLRFTNDTPAIHDLYRTQNQSQQQSQVRSSGTFYPGSNNSSSSFSPANQTSFQQNRQAGMSSGTSTTSLGPSFHHWRGNVSQMQQGYMESGHGSVIYHRQHRPPFGPVGHSGIVGGGGFIPLAPYQTSNTSPGPQGASEGVSVKSPVGAGGSFGFHPSSQNGSRQESAAGNQPTPTLSINPVRVKQEPRESFPSSCSLSASKPNSQSAAGPVPSPGTQPSPRLQSPANASSGLTSPSLVQNQEGNRMVSPVIPDAAVIEEDVQEALKKLNPNYKYNTYNLYHKHDPNDPSEDYCAVCHNGGDLLCCDRCPKVFHLQCHIPVVVEKIDSNDQWFCTLCIPDDELKLDSPVHKDSYIIIPGTGKRKAPSGLVDKEIKVCERILLELFCMESSVVFHEPVSKQVPNYYKIITNPMDFGKIKLKLRRGHFNHYNSIEEFLSDLKLVFKNCYTYNPSTSEIYQVGKSVETFLEYLVQRFLPCYFDYFQRVTPSPVSDMSDSERSQPKKRRSPAPDSAVSSSVNNISSSSSSIPEAPVHFH